MDRPDRTIWFLGDLGDPWVTAIAEALPASALRLACAGDFPEEWPDGIEQARTLVVHRALLTLTDADRLRKLIERPAAAEARVILCAGQHARYHDLQRWASWVDVILPEATAPETVARHLGAKKDSRRDPCARGDVTIVSALTELRLALVEACEEAGYTALALSEWPAERVDGLAVWDVPVLDDDWPVALGRQARRTRILALLGFADRVSVSLARAQGAAACLDLPCDPADLVHVLDRLASAAQGAGGGRTKRVRLRPPQPVSTAPPDATSRRKAGTRAMADRSKGA